MRLEGRKFIKQNGKERVCKLLKRSEQKNRENRKFTGNVLEFMAYLTNCANLFASVGKCEYFWKSSKSVIMLPSDVSTSMKKLELPTQNFCSKE